MYFTSGTFLAQTRAVYCETMTSSLRVIRRKLNKKILEMHKILLLLFNYSIKILKYYMVILLKIQQNIFILLKIWWYDFDIFNAYLF